MVLYYNSLKGLSQSIFHLHEIPIYMKCLWEIHKDREQIRSN